MTTSHSCASSLDTRLHTYMLTHVHSHVFTQIHTLTHMHTQVSHHRKVHSGKTCAEISQLRLGEDGADAAVLAQISFRDGGRAASFRNC